MLDRQLIEFDVVVVHTLDRWSRNQMVLLESQALLARNQVTLVSITEPIDWATPLGPLRGEREPLRNVLGCRDAVAHHLL